MSDSEERFTKEEENNTGDQSDHGSSGNASPREKCKSSRSRSPERSKSSRHRSKSRSRSGSRRYRSRSRSRSRRSYSRSRSRSYHSRSRSRSYSPHQRYSRSKSRSPKRRRRSRSSRRNRDGHSHSKSPMSNRRRHDGNRDNPEESRCLGVFGLSLYSTERDIREVFERYGAIEQCTVVYDHQYLNVVVAGSSCYVWSIWDLVVFSDFIEHNNVNKIPYGPHVAATPGSHYIFQTGRSRGFAFVTFESTDDAREAKDQTNGKEVDGRRLRVDYSITKRAHTPTPGIYMGKATYPERRRERDSYGGGGGRDRYNDRYNDRSDRYRRSPSPRYYGGGRRDDYYRRSPSPYYSRRRYSRSRSRSYSRSPRRY